MKKDKEYAKRMSDYIGSQINEMQKTIAFYKEVGARKNLQWEESELAKLNQSKSNWEGVLSDPDGNKKTGPKVVVVVRGDVLVIETLDTEKFDMDFMPNGEGRIGCSLDDNSRLLMSNEAVDFLNGLEKVRDAIGDVMGDKERFVWIGGPTRIIERNSVVSRDFRLPVGFVAVSNDHPINTVGFNPETVEEEADGKDSYEIWIELQENGNHFFLINTEGANFVGRNGRPKNKEEIYKIIFDIFKQNEERVRFGSDIKVPVENIMSYVNGLFDLGFDNNVMNPRKDYWRMSFRGTPEEILNKLKSFKK